MFNDVTELLVSKEYNIKLLHYVCVHIAYQSDVGAICQDAVCIFGCPRANSGYTYRGLTH